MIAKGKTVENPTTSLVPRRSTLMNHAFGGNTVERERVLQRSVGNQTTTGPIAHQAPRLVGNESPGNDEQETARGVGVRLPWSFSVIPVFPHDQTGRNQPLSAPLPTMRLPDPIQASHAVRQPNDPLERETHRVADQMTRIPAAGVSDVGAPPHVCSKCASRAENKQPQTTVGACCAHNFEAISAERKDGVVHGPAGAANRFDDCPARWKPAANAAQKLGGSWLANVVNGLTSLPKPIPVPVANLLLKHFHTTFDKDIAEIAGRYRQLNTAINQSIDFQCETSCDPNVLAYVYSVWSDLHLCPYWFNSGAELQASTVVHELAHDVVGCDDNAYEWQTAKYSNMSVNDAINNADSYAHFAWDAARPPRSAT